MSREKEYALSISIPTFGYPDAIKETVARLLKIKRSDVEIVVVDNDETGRQIGEFMEGISDVRFRYFRNDTNIGRSANIVRAIERASSDYVLLMSSDDRLRLEAVDAIIEAIEKNPGCAILMGKVLTEREGTWGYGGKARTYRAGYEALCVTPRSGNLYPFVVNKRYLDFDKLYRQEETYMQARLGLVLSGQGDFVGMEDVIAEAIDNITWRYSKKDLQYYELMDWGKDAERVWSLGKCYYSPQERAHQLERDLACIEEHPLRMSHLLHLVDAYTTQGIFKALLYVAVCHDPFNIKNGGTVGFMGCEGALSAFERIMQEYFLEREKKHLYYYTGHLRDKIQNELLNVEVARKLMQDILYAESVFVLENGTSTKPLKGILGKMGIRVKDEIKDSLVLSSTNYDARVEADLLKNGAKRVFFMDWMEKYLTIVWCDQHQSKEYMGNYAEFL